MREFTVTKLSLNDHKVQVKKVSFNFQSYNSASLPTNLPPFFPHKPPSLPLCSCHAVVIKTRRLRGDQIEVFKILNGHENIDPNIFFKIKTGKITRGHDFTLVKGQNRLDFRKYSFSQRTVNEWNKLSADCVHSSSVNMFKNRIDNYLVRAGYT